MLRMLAMAATAVVSAAAVAAEPRPVACGDAPAERIADPLGRDGLAALECPLPDAWGSLLIVSDDSISWPVVLRPDGRTSLEDALLSDVGLLGPGLAYFEPDEGAVRFEAAPPARVLLAFRSADPATLEPRTRWLAVALEPVAVLGAADTPEAAAALEP